MAQEQAGVLIPESAFGNVLLWQLSEPTCRSNLQRSWWSNLPRFPLAPEYAYSPRPTYPTCASVGRGGPRTVGYIPRGSAYNLNYRGLFPVWRDGAIRETLSPYSTHGSTEEGMAGYGHSVRSSFFVVAKGERPAVGYVCVYPICMTGHIKGDSMASRRAPTRHTLSLFSSTLQDNMVSYLITGANRGIGVSIRNVHPKVCRW